jgi:hypothetical protein
VNEIAQALKAANKLARVSTTWSRGPRETDATIAAYQMHAAVGVDVRFGSDGRACRR